MMIKSLKPCVAVAGLTILSSLASAYEKGNMIINVGAAKLDVSENAGSIVVTEPFEAVVHGAKSGTSNEVNLVGSFQYFIDDKWSLEAFVSDKYEHDIYAAGTLSEFGKVGEMEFVPYTLNLVHYPLDKPFHGFSPLIGVGINYSVFGDVTANDRFNQAMGETLTNLTNVPVQVERTSIELDNSLSYTLKVGFDYHVNKWFNLHMSVAYIHLDSEAFITSTTNAGVASFTENFDANAYSYGIGVGFVF